MIYIFSQFLQRGESYAYEDSIPSSVYRVCSQPETVYKLRFNAEDRIILVGVIPDKLWNVIELVRAKSPAQPLIERIWTS